MPLILAVGVLVWGTLPALLTLSALVDLVRWRRFAVTRTLLVLALFLACESIGLAALTLAWVVNIGAPERLVRHTRAVQMVWTSAQFFGLTGFFGMRLRMEGREHVLRGPYIMLPRHVSTADTLLPLALLARPEKLRARYVLKRELLWDPCLDVAGQRLPNVFVRRGSRGRELPLLEALARGMDEQDIVVIYPEGTRFTPERRQRLIARLEERGDAAMAARARALSATLPPQPAGVEAMLTGAPEADVVIVGHRGFEGAKGMGDLLNGRFVGREVVVRFRRYPRAEVPTEPDARQAWLQDRWAEMDRWVAAGG